MLLPLLVNVPHHTCHSSCCCCRTVDSERIKYLPTIYPYDSVLTMWRKGTQTPEVVTAADTTDAHSTIDVLAAAAAASTAGAGVQDSASAAAAGLRQRSRPQRA